MGAAPAGRTPRGPRMGAGRPGEDQAPARLLEGAPDAVERAAEPQP